MLKSSSIKRKLIVINITATFSALFLSAILFIFYEYNVFKINLVESLQVQSRIVAKNSSAAIMFNDSDATEDILSALRSSRNVLFAAIYKPDGRLFAEYNRGNLIGELFSRQIIEDGYDFETSTLELYHIIHLDSEVVGSIRIVSDLKALDSLMLWHASVVFLVLLLSLLLALLLLTKLQKKITEPIMSLSMLMSSISRSKDYSQRASVHADDEIGDLAIVCNDMLDQIQIRDDELGRHSQKLQKEVQVQTLEIKANNRALKNTVLKLKKAKDFAEAANNAKSQFLANMSHEVRTPLNGIIGLTDLLKHSELTEKQKSKVNSILNSGVSLLGVINDILDFSKIEAGKMELETFDFSLRKTVEDVINSFSDIAIEKGLQLKSSIQVNPEFLVCGDPLRFRQILMNLIGNALKFTDRGEVVLKLDVKEKKEYINVSFEIRDTGIGINQKNLEKIFHSFTQADGSSTREYGGTGLGLAISKQLIEMMGGEIGVDSKPGMGTTFWFRIAFQKAKTPVLEKDFVLEDKESTSFMGKFNAHVLVVEDNIVNQTVAKEMLEYFGLRVDVASDGLESLDAMSNNMYNLVFMDCQMPLMDGFEATGHIRKREMASAGNTVPVHIPIIALTARAMEGDRELCLSAGMDDYVSKPFNLEEIYLILNHWISDRMVKGSSPGTADTVPEPE